MQIHKDYDLSELNTFGIKAKAKFFVQIEKEKDLEEVFLSPEFKENKKLFLGGGSNVLFSSDFDGIVVLNKLKGIEVLKDGDGGEVLVRAMGGEWWNDLVLFSVSHEYWGIENLSLIPGTVGASPVQNIGAYGVELKDSLYQVEAFEVDSGKKRIFSNEECNFGYRDSVFKNELKGKYFISAIVLRLSKNRKNNFEYKALKEYIEKNKIDIKSPKDVSDIVKDIRQSKLPDPKIVGNAGSFFKNVFVDEAQMEKIKKEYPEVPLFKEGENTKIPAGWLIEKCGPEGGAGASWKGYRRGNVGVHDKQALVLVNFGGASGEEIINLAKDIIESVKNKFGIALSPEVNII